MLLAVILCLVVSAVRSTRDQPPGCPLPTGPYVPPKCGDNEYFEVCSFKCPPQTCSSLWFEEPCTPGDGCCRNECRCQDGYLRNEAGHCIPKDKCCKPYKVTEDCEEPEPSRGPYCNATCAEPNPQNCAFHEKHSCRGGYVFHEGKCIKISNCPQNLGCNGDENAVIKACPSPCPLTCDSPDLEPCDFKCLGAGCSCKNGYILSKKGGKCIKPNQCPVTTPKPDCNPTCAEPNPPNCENNCTNVCAEGFVLSEKGGKCIKIENCPQDLGCNGDENAVIKSCPPPCPSTCYSPNEMPCRKACLPLGCACKFGFILTGEGGKCIEPNRCPDGHPCGLNGTFVSDKMECPDAFCAVDDSRGIIACDPAFPSRSGCVCKLGYKRINTDDRHCILADECPPVVCTRPNESYDCCPSACLAESCIDVDNQPSTCNTLVYSCDPKCICNEGYFRNATDICIPAADCHSN